MKLRSNVSTSLSDATVGADGRLTIRQLNLSEEPDTPNSVITKSYLDARLEISIGTPGSVIFKPLKTTPPGYLKCNGAAVSRTTYADLYKVIGDRFSSFPVKGSGQPWRHQYGINNSLDYLYDKGWYKTATLPATNAHSQVIVTKNRVYLFSRFSGTTYTATVYTAMIMSDGSLSSWATSSINLPQALSYSQAIVVNNYVYLIGGYNGTYRTNIYRAFINTDGSLGSFVSYGNLPVSVSHSQALVTKNRLYLIGGYVGGVISNRVYTTSIDELGNLGSWILGPNLPMTVHSHCATVIRDRIYVMGGMSESGASREIFYADINPEGTIDAWIEDFSLPEVMYSMALMCSRHRVFLFGGIIRGSPSNVVYCADIHPDGTLAGWSIVGVLPETSYGTTPLITSSTVYLLGGYLNSAVSNRVNAVDYTGGLNDYSPYYNPASTELPNGNFRLPDYSFLEPYRIYAYMKI